eukprot:411095-Amphidinium_carterae.1
MHHPLLDQKLPITRYASQRKSLIASKFKAFESHEVLRARVCKGSLSLLTSTGAIPSSLNPWAVFLNHNLLEGTLPQRLLGGSEQAREVVVAKALECPTCHQGQ